MSCVHKMDNQTGIKAKAAPIDSTEIKYPSLWVYGGIPGPKDEIREVVDNWYNFKYSFRGGCLISPEKGTKEHNEKTDSILSARIGKDWEQRFDKSVDSLYFIDYSAISIAMADAYVKKFKTATENKYNEKYKFYLSPSSYKCYPTSDDNIRVVAVDGWGIVYKHTGRYRYLTITVDLKKKKVLNIDKTGYGWRELAFGTLY